MMQNSKFISSKFFWLLFCMAALSFLFTLNLSHIGEEGIYTISSFEMWYSKHYLYPFLYGENYGRPPLFNWLIIFFSKFTGWSQMLLASRLVTGIATISTGFALSWFAKKLFHDKNFAAFAAIAYLTTDALFYHGWLAYSDPLFSFCIFVAVAILWVACIEVRFELLIVAILALFAAFLTKAITAYVFYGTAFLILLYLGKRKFLLHPISIILHVVGLLLPLGWVIITNNANGSSMLNDVWHWGYEVGKGLTSLNYLSQLAIFPLEILARLCPISAIAIYCFFRSRNKSFKSFSPEVKFLFLFSIINFIPYLIAVKHTVRYVLPLYPFVVLFCAHTVWNANKRAVQMAVIWFVIAVVLKYVTVFFWWPNYQKYYRGDYNKVAHDVVLQVRNHHLYINSLAGAREHSVAYHINILFYPMQPPLKNTNFISSNEKNYFIFAAIANKKWGKVLKEYSLGDSHAKLYLMCHGDVCR